MSISAYPQGSIAELRVSFLDKPGGQPTDPAAIELQIFKDSALVHGPKFLGAGDIVRDLTGVFHYDWLVPADQATGTDYTATWTATIGGAFRTGYELFSISEGGAVEPSPVLAWASVADVAALTDQEVSGAVVSRAQGIVELFTGRSYADSDRMSARDLSWLKRAVAYQAAWLPANPDVFERLDLAEVQSGSNASGLSVTPKAMVLAPMTRWALKRVSWLKSRSLQVRSPLENSPAGADPLLESNDDLQRWTPIGGR